MTQSEIHHLLLVEDSASDANLFMQYIRLGQIAKEVTCVKTGEAALMYLRQAEHYADAVRPDLIVLDLVLPGLSGQDLLAIIKTDPLLRQIPVLIFTGSTLETDIQRAYSLHANCYLEKPLDARDYTTMLKAIEEFWLNLAVLPSKPSVI